VTIASLPTIKLYIAFNPFGYVGTANSFTATTLTDTAAAWTTNQWAGQTVTAAGSSATIVSNTATVLTVTAWSSGVPSGSSFTIGSIATTNQIPFSNTSVWTDCSAYLRDFSTKSGKQHYLDRVESSTVKMTLNNRDGFFNGSPNTIGPRLPVAITATWQGTTYPTFYGIIDSVTEKLADALNSDLDVEASDLLKYLSLKYLHRPSFWQTYAASPAAQSWYRCSNYAVATVTSATSNSAGTAITYNIINSTVNFYVGGNVNVTVTGLAGLTTFNITNLPIASVTSSGGVVTSFTVNVTVTANTTSQSAGLVYLNTLYDYMGNTNGTFSGQVSYPNNGVIIYDTDGCVDLSGSGNVAAGALSLPRPLSSPNFGGIDFWVLGQQTSLNQIAQVYFNGTVSSSYSVVLSVGNAGVLHCFIGGSSSAAASSSNFINDGYWHHVGLAIISGTLYLYCDGVFYSTGQIATEITYPTGGIVIGANASNVFSYNGQIDEIVISSVASTVPTEIQQRYRAGSMLQLGYPVTPNKCYSADRIGEILTLAGFGTITGGTSSAQASLSVPQLVIGNGPNTAGTTPYSYGSGQGAVATEPYYWDSPINGSTALDLIQQITDTDIGSFYQYRNGQFHFNPQTYYGTWSFTPASTPVGTPTYSWTKGSYANVNTISDDDSGYPYEINGLDILTDDVDLWTTVRITPQAGVDQIYENTGNEGRWGYSTLSKSSTVSCSLADAQSTAYFLGYIFRTPLPRVNSVTLTSEVTVGGVEGYNLPVMLGANFADVIAFRRTPPNAGTSPYINLQMAVESITHDFSADPGYWHTTLTLDPYPVRN